MKIETLRGMKDIVFSDIKKYEYIVKVAKEVFEKYGYERIITPIVEETELFKRSVGDETDVVSKEMYTFLDKGNRSITLRPEGTAGIVRSYLNNGLYKSNPNVKWYYYGSMYRYEAPQKGRYREFHQIGIESLGIRSAFLDAEIIKMGTEFLRRLGITDLTVEINSLGNTNSRKRYIEDLQKTLLENIENLSYDSKIRAEKNPLRVLDSKDEKDKEVIKKVSSLHEYFDEESKNYFNDLKTYLEKLNVKYVVNDKLVRGLDYYSDTVFEIKSNKLGAQSTVLAGGRYDKLTSILANVDSFGVGFAAGIERIMLLLDEDKLPLDDKKVYVVYQNETKDYFLKVINSLLENDIKLIYEYEVKSFSAQMKKANKIGASHVIILGIDEKNENLITLKDFVSGSQEKIDIDTVIERLKNV